MKGLITAAGLGKRSGLDGKMRKEMLPVYDLRDGKVVLRPIIDVIINKLKRHGITSIAVVLDPADRWTQSYMNIEFPEVRLLFQQEKLGFGHAVLMAKEFIAGDSFILNAGDGIVLNEDVISEMTESDNNTIGLVLMEVTDPEKYGTAEFERRGDQIKVRSVVEKSSVPPSNYALCAFYRLTSDVFEFLEADRSSNVELTPAINSAIQKGIPAMARIIEKSEWASVGRSESYVDVLNMTLEKCRKKLI